MALGFSALPLLSACGERMTSGGRLAENLVDARLTV
jgi:hypothetical protein